jgi:cell division GTPase FtsZ
MYCSFLGLGAAGNNIADLAASRGFHSLAINFSKMDLESLEYIDEHSKLHLIGSEGIGKQRNHAMSLMNNNWDLAVSFVKEHFSHPSIEIIFVPFATSGGSGSGIAPILLQLLMESMPTKVFVAMPIFPSKDEAFICQKNCQETMEDLSKLDLCLLPIDNDKAKSKNINMGKNNLYKRVNEFVVSMIEDLVSYTDKPSQYGVLDRNDLKNIFKTKGLCTIGETTLAGVFNKFEMNEKGITNSVKESWIRSLFADIELDQIMSAGFIFDGQEQYMNLIQMEDIFNGFGNKMPISLYEGFYKGDKGGKIITILSGLGWCNSRLQEIDEIIFQTSEVFNNLNQQTIYKSKLSEIKMPLANEKVKEQRKVNDISSIINKFKRN